MITNWNRGLVATSCLVVDYVGSLPKSVNAAETCEVDLCRDSKVREIKWKIKDTSFLGQFCENTGND